MKKRPTLIHKQPRILLLLIVLAVFLGTWKEGPNLAFAGGLEFPDLGTVAIGRGGSFTAKADNLSAFHYNPAGLSKSKGINILMGSNLVQMNLTFTRGGTEGFWIGKPGDKWIGDTCPNGEICIFNPGANYADGEPQNYSSITGGGIGPMPMLVANWGDVGGIKGLSLTMGLLPPSSFGMPSYSENGAQRYALINANHLIIFPGVGVSYAFNKYFQIGAVFLSGIGHFRQSMAIRPAPSLADNTFHNEDPGGDAVLGLDAKDHFIPSGIIGVMSHPVDWLELGLTVKLPAHIDASGTLSYEAPSQDMVDSTLARGRDKITMRQHFPLMVRAGVRYIHKLFDVEVDFVWENWSSLKQFEILPDAAIFDGLNSNTEMPNTSIPKNFRDTFSVRLGGDIQVWPKHIAIRLGGFYQSSAYPKNLETFSIDFPFADQLGLGGGLSWHVGSMLDVNAGYMHIFQPDIIVDKGIVQQMGLPLSSGEEIGNTINSGKYEVNLNLFGVSLEGHF